MGQPNLGVPPQPRPAPPAPPANPFPLRPGPPLRRLAPIFAVLPFAAYGACATKVVRDDTGFYLWVGAALLSLTGATVGGVTLYRAAKAKEPRSFGAAFALIVGILSVPISFFLGLSTIHISRGRALRRGGRPRLPETNPTTSTGGWAADAGAMVLPEEAALGWIENARTEIASVAAFNHLANELLAIGAPAALVRGALEASLEEVAHAEVCFAIAGRGDLAAFPEASTPPDRRPTPEALARDCAIEACWLEGASARVATYLAAVPGVPEPIRGALETIAREEERHAEHGFQVLAYLVARHGDAILDRARRALADERDRHVDVPERDPSLERWGLAGRKVWERAVRDAFRDVEARLATMSSRRAAA